MVVSVVADIIVARRDSGSYYAMAVIDLPVFLRQESLLDPRDVRPSGRRNEYLGVRVFKTPWNPMTLCQKELSHEMA
jgi:hypothetical protein